MTDTTDTSTDSSYIPAATTIHTFGAHVVCAAVESMARTTFDAFIQRVCALPGEDAYGFDMTQALNVSRDDDVSVTLADIRRRGGVAPELYDAARAAYREIKHTLYYIWDYSLITTKDTYTSAGMTAFALFDPQLGPYEEEELRAVAEEHGGEVRYAVITVADVFEE